MPERIQQIVAAGIGLVRALPGRRPSTDDNPDGRESGQAAQDRTGDDRGLLSFVQCVGQDGEPPWTESSEQNFKILMLWPFSGPEQSRPQP